MGKKFDVVIIGAGISGLTSAAILSRFGLSVCVLEMDARPGGYIAGFRRKDYRFDSAIHWLNQCGPKGLVTQAFQIIGNDFPKAKQQDHIRRFIGDDINFLITKNVDLFRNQLIKEFPTEEKGINRFFRDARRIGKSFDNFKNVNRSMSTMNLFEKGIRGMRMLRFALPFIPQIRYAGDEGVKKGLSKYFKNEKLLSIFSSEPDLLSCLIPISWAYIGDFQTPPPGGSQAYAEWLQHVVNQYKNDIIFRARVTEIEVEQGLAKSVKYDHKGKHCSVQGKYVIAACDVETLYEQMLPKGTASPKFLKKLKGAELYSSAVTLSIALDCTAESLGFGEEVIYLTQSGVTRKEEGSGDPHKCGIHILAASVRDKSLAPKGGGTITVFIPGYIDQYDNWKTERDENDMVVRGQAYKELKQKVAEIILGRIEDKLCIELRKHIVYLDIATPITHQRYTGNKGGTMMGARPCKENMKAKVAHYKTPVGNLYLSGHWAELGGGIPIAVRSAVNSSLLVLKEYNKPSFNLLAKYIDGRIDKEKVNSSSCIIPYDENWKQTPTPAMTSALNSK